MYVRVYLHMYTYAFVFECRSGICVPLPSRNVYLEIDGKLLLDRVQPLAGNTVFLALCFVGERLSLSTVFLAILMLPY